MKRSDVGEHRRPACPIRRLAGWSSAASTSVAGTDDLRPLSAFREANTRPTHSCSSYARVGFANCFSRAAQNYRRAACAPSALAFALALLLATPSFAQQAKKKGISVGEPPADHSPEAELASFKVLDGFEVNLFASEKDGVPNALVIRWDERGRLWCLQTSAYPQPAPGEIVDDKVVILEDTDHDGRTDKTTVFADGLRMPMGMELGAPGELYVGEGEKLWLFRDTNGDDRVDEKEVVFSGFGTGDAHQNLNSFVWAPDGSLVMHQGLHCYSRVATPHGVKQLYGAGFWHYWPRSRRLDAYPTGMPQNPWGTAFDKWGQPIMVAGAAGMFWARPMEISVPENPDQEGLPYFLLTRFMLPSSGQIIKTDGLRKFCGVDIVGNSHWPDNMQDEVISGGFFENAIFRYKIIDDKDNPSGFEAIEQPPLITSDNVAFRPVDVRFGPDGALYIADWYNPIIGHYQASFRHPNRDKTHGRIWRVTAKGRERQNGAVDLPELFGTATASTDQEAMQAARRLYNHSALGDRWTSYQAARLLASLPKKTALTVASVRTVFPSTMPAEQQESLARLNALTRLSVFECFEEPFESLLSEFLSAGSSDMRTQATHAIGNLADHLPSALSLVEAGIADESPRVRLEAIVAAAKVKSPDAIRVALKALDKPMDSFLDRALWLAVHATAPQWKPSIVVPPKHLAYLVEKEGSAEILGVARTLLEQQAGTLNDGVRRALSAALVRKGEPVDMLRALKLGQKDQGILDDLAEAAARRGFKAPVGSLPLMRKLLETGTDVQRVASCRLAAAWGVKDLKSSVETLAGVSTASTGHAVVRVAAIESLGKLGADAAKIQPMVVNAQESWPVRIAALNALAETHSAEAGSAAAEAFSGITDADTMRLWLAPLLPRDAATKSLSAALNAKPATADAAKLAIRVLAGTGRSEPELSAVLSGIIGVSNTVPAYNPEWVNALAAEVKAKGDTAKGRAVFASPLVNCTACHSIGKQGGVIGPELDAVGRGVPVELLIEAVVWPNRQIKEGYIATTLLTKDGRRLQGYKISDANGELQLKDFLSSTISRFAAGDIKERQEAGSLMPEGLIMNMTREELRDLIAYLASLGL